MKILVTGFDSFGEDRINPALEAVKRLPDNIAGAKIIKLEIPTKFNISAEVVKEAIENYKPDYVLNVGQAGGRFAITPERVAINLDDGRIADNAGYQPLNQTIQSDGATAYFTQLPIKAMTKAIREVGLPATVSNSADIKAGFIHIPYLPEQVISKPQMPSLSLADDIKGLIAAISAIVERDGQGDINTIEGSIH